MSEDRLDKALEAMKNEPVNSGELARAHDRVRDRLVNPGEGLCAEIRTHFVDYLAGNLEAGRRMLVEDHLGRCTGCRAALAAQKGERPAAVVPMRRASHWPRWGTWAAAAAVLLGVLYLGRSTLDTLLALGLPRATVASVTGTLYRVPQGILEPGATIGENETVRTGPGSRAVLELADGSLLDVNERTELSVRAAWSGRTVHLQRGDIIVKAARQRHGHLRVQTRDALASVKGTVFAVSSGLSGSLVSVVEGSVAVAQGGTESLLSPGEQAASNPALIGSVREAVAWSPDAETYLAILASLAHIEKQVAGLPSPALRTQSRLLELLPPDTVVYGAMPNIGDTIGRTIGFADQQASGNPAFGQWWDSGSGQSLKQLLGQAETLTHLLGDEIVFAFSQGQTGTSEKLPLILAEVQAGKQMELAAALDSLAGRMGAPSLRYHLTDSLLVLSDSERHLQTLVAGAGGSEATPFTREIAARYQRGAGWLLGMDIESILARSGSTAGAGGDFVGAHQTKHLFLERRDPRGVEENALTLTFRGPRMGMASFLANSGSGGAAEYIPADVFAAGYVSTREPRQIFDEMLRLATRSDPSALDRLAEAEAKLGVSLSGDLAAAIGTESAFGIESLSTKGPVWMMAALVNDPAMLDASIRRLVDAWNAESAKQGRTERILLGQETANGLAWTSLTSSSSPLGVVWTYDRGTMVAASDRGAALRAIATRNGGSPLVWSGEFQSRLPGSTGMHPSAFFWLNTKGAFQGYAALFPNPAVRELIAERDPILAAFSATEEQIRAASRTRLSGLIMDLMLLESMGRLQAGS